MNRNPPTEVPDQGDRTEDLHAKKTRLRPLPIDPHYKTIQWTELPGIQMCGTFGRRRPNFIRNREESTSPEKMPGKGKSKQLGPLTINADKMSDSDIEQIISDTQQSGQDLHTKDTNGKVTYNTFEEMIESDLELASNLSSSTEIEKEIENIEETNLRRSKRLTKTNPIVRLNDPIHRTDDRKHRKTAESVTTTGDNRRNGAGQRRKPVNRSHYKTNHFTETRHADHGNPDTSITRRPRHIDHNSNLDDNGTPLDTYYPIAEGEMKSNRHHQNR